MDTVISVLPLLLSIVPAGFIVPLLPNVSVLQLCFSVYNEGLSWCVFLTASLFILLYTHMCDSQTYYVYSERGTLNATQLKLKSLNCSQTKLCLT